MLHEALKDELKNRISLVTVLSLLTGEIIGLATTIVCSLYLSGWFWLAVPIVAWSALSPMASFIRTIIEMSKEEEG